MRRPSSFTLLAVTTAALTACGSTVITRHETSGAGGSGAMGSTAASTGGSTAASTGGSGGAGMGGSGGAGNCPACTADQWCYVPNPCTFPATPYTCVACQQLPYCAADGTVYPTECAAMAAGQAGGLQCSAPAGSYACGSYFCNATNEDCGLLYVGDSFSEPTCVPCASVSGRVCGNDGNVYPSACALLQAGHVRGTSCPGFVDCGGVVCDLTVSSCVMSIIADCQGGTPTEVCIPGADAGP